MGRLGQQPDPGLHLPYTEPAARGLRDLVELPSHEIPSSCPLVITTSCDMHYTSWTALGQDPALSKEWHAASGETKPQLSGDLTCGYVVGRGGVEPPIFRFSGGDGDLLAAEARVKGGVNQVVALRQKVPVGVDGCGDRLMSKALLDVREGHTGGDEPGDVGVP